MGRRTRLPPLKALHAFTSAAAHLNFSKAAEELCVTAGAVSYQVRLLERALGASLFERLPRGLELTQKGVTLQAACEHAFGELSDAVDTVRSGSQNFEIRVISVPHFSARILFPARQEFMKKHPNYNLIIDHSLTVPDFSEDGYDFAILFGKGSWPGVTSELLFNSPTAPACAPSLIERHGASMLEKIHSIPVLLDHNCFHEMWVDWFAAAGLRGWERLNFIPVNDFHALLTTTAQGLGLVMEPDFVIEEHLAKGQMVRPFDTVLDTYGYHLAYPSDTLGKKSCRVFRDWLMNYVSEHLDQRSSIVDLLPLLDPPVS